MNLDSKLKLVHENTSFGGSLLFMGVGGMMLRGGRTGGRRPGPRMKPVMLAFSTATSDDEEANVPEWEGGNKA